MKRRIKSCDVTNCITRSAEGTTLSRGIQRHVPPGNFEEEHLKIRILVQSRYNSILTFHKIGYPLKLRWKNRFVNLKTKCYEKNKNAVILEYCTESMQRDAFLTVKIEILCVTFNT